ncbi:hypothetical protein NLJ89_g2609 [Agrocybe chaxingu]|uniref:Uncharacterized protein n=1 Tax=Agrocybe chaxingu TaxID=84603 RepID=A0A9W8K766_9AGAR|nr:hypothetical protein NLJ89_g2609 [Agrocybe chaxingu]
MPGIRAALRDVHHPGTLSLTFRMPPNTLDHPANDSQTPPLNDQGGDASASVLVFLSARCIGSVGFAVSLFAIWFGWLLPAAIMAPAPPAAVEINPSRVSSKPRRVTSAAPASRRLRKPIRRVSAPVDLTPILAPPAEDTQLASRHVYFVDKDLSPIVRRNTMPEPCKSSPTSQSIDQLIHDSLTQNLRPTPSTQPHCNSTEETPAESDSSRHSSRTSLLRHSRLHKLKLNFQSKSYRAELQDKPFDQSSLASTETGSSDKSARRASAGFIAPWTLTRNRTASDVTAEAATASPSRLSFRRRASPSRPGSSPARCPASAAADILSPVFASRKAQKRISAPIPRTSPYGAPYFAAPPIASDTNYPAYLKTLPQFEDEIKGAPTRTASDGEDVEPVRGRSSIRRVSLNPPQVLPKRRSASEDWTQRT